MRWGRSTSTNVTSAQLKRLQRRLHAKARAGPAADRVDPREVPVDQVVVGELGVVGDVLQVVEDLLARRGDDDRDAHGSTAGGTLYAARGHPAGRWTAPAGAGDDGSQAARASSAHGVAVLAVAYGRARPRAAPRDGAAAQLAHGPRAPPAVDVHCSPTSGVRPQSAQLVRSACSAPIPRRSSTISSLSRSAVAVAIDGIGIRRRARSILRTADPGTQRRLQGRRVGSQRRTGERGAPASRSGGRSLRGFTGC